MSEQQPIIIVKKKVSGHGHHGGAWKVAFADFMTAMFAMFLVLWLVNQSSDIKSAIAGYFQDPLGRGDEFGSSLLPGEGSRLVAIPRPMVNAEVLNLRRQSLREMQKTLRQRFHTDPNIAAIRDHVEILLTNEGLEIQLIENDKGFFFESGKPEPSTTGKLILSILGAELGELNLPVRIAGHTDSIPFQRADGYNNWDLSAERANICRHIMVRSGLQPEQVDQVRAFADTRPKFPGAPEDPRNRRVTITMLLQTEEDFLYELNE